jgi:hypothetical protein
VFELITVAARPPGTNQTAESANTATESANRRTERRTATARAADTNTAGLTSDVIVYRRPRPYTPSQTNTLTHPSEPLGTA